MYSSLRNLRFVYPLLLMAVSFMSCEKEDMAPKVETISAVPYSSSEFEAKAKFIERGNLKIIDVGFILSPFEYDLNGFGEVPRVSLGPISENSFSASIHYNSSYAKYYVRAYAQDTKGTVYGKILEFNSLQPSFHYIEPMRGVVGDTIAIYGENLDALLSDISIRFNNQEAKVINNSSTEIHVEVPKIDLSYSPTARIDVNVANKYFSVQGFFLIPKFFSFNPKSGTWDDIVVVDAENFYYRWDSNVYFMLGDIICYPYGFSQEWITFQIPRQQLLENSPVKVFYYGEEYTLDGSFTMQRVEIESISKDQAILNENLSVYGKNFFPFYYYQTNYGWVKVGDKEAAISYATTNEINFSVPVTVTDGVHDIIVSNGFSTDTLKNALEVIVPEVTDFSPSEVYSNQVVTFNGKGFSQYISISANGYSFWITEYDFNQIKARVPFLLGGGEHYLNVEVNGYSTSLTQKLKVLNSKIESFTPSEGFPGSIVEIRGKGLPVEYYSTVNFGSKSAMIISRTDSLYKVYVPYDAPQNVCKLKILLYGKELISEDEFTIK